MAPPLPAEMLYSGEEEKHANDEVVYICHYRGSLKGTLYLTNFRLIFMGASSESFIVLPLGMIEKIEKIGGHSNKGEHKYGLEITCRDLRSLFFAHPRDNHSRRPVYELISKLAFPYTTESLVYAFKYNGRRDSAYRQGDEVTEGWQLFSMRKEFERMGVNPSQWRVSDINKDYRLCPTYPSELILPCATPDADIQAVAKFRSKGRLPALVWMHPMTQATITRCSQPRVGVTRKRCPQDEAYLETIRGLGGADDPLFIMDARPRRNARANQAKGLGYESTANYPNCIMTFLNIHNIHVMRESLRKMRELVWPKPDEAHWYQRLEATGWLKHSKTILAAAVAIVDKVTRGKSVLIHCSDGWDRTAQLASLSLLMMDPYYRTVEGFMVLIEKEWLAYGHKFAQRLGLGDRNAADDQRSPVFLQFLDCVWQMTQQHPCAFEFNEDMLVYIADEMFSCMFGTFLYNTERERTEAHLKTRTLSVWDHILSNKDKYTNLLFSAKTQKHILTVVASMRLLRVWQGYFLRWSLEYQTPESMVERLKELQETQLQLQAKIASMQAEQRQQRGGAPQQLSVVVQDQDVEDDV
eukprot:TRINITY_DN11408_c0_g1_i3.p1 TRINITY_DN11408_c0_g1~~TRINITY_DN11408_c0_g1_i3.p1  ORF type:complete len:582 (+),score=117.50 TRINITY_DN11408_c0_g1_i3:2-1747(+)